MIIETVRPEDLKRVLQHALGRVVAEQRDARVQACLDLTALGTLDSRLIWVARDGDEILGVQVCVPLSGSACLFWLPTTTEPVADLLVQAALDGVHAQGCKIAQVLARPEEQPWVGPLVRRGFQPVARLQQMAHSLTGLPMPIPATLRYETYCPSIADEFAATLERTYIASLDCPELNGVRSIDEIVNGHKAQGKFHPEFWWLVRERDQGVGVMMLAEMPDAMTWELIYIGLTPEARGRGIGRALMVDAMHALLKQPIIAMTLAVDSRNVPAKSLYASLGFIEIESHDALLYRW